MTILVDENTRVIVQGITGRQGRIHTELMCRYGTKIVAGVTPSKAGDSVFGVPVYDTVEEALEEHDANASIIFVPAPSAGDAVLEAIDAGLSPVVVVTEHIPVHDTIRFIASAREKGVRIIGPNTPGIISPNKCKLGIMPSELYIPGSVGLVSRSGTLSYEVTACLGLDNIGVSTAVGIGGDRIIGTCLREILELFEKDEKTEAIVLIGEIGGAQEEDAADYISKSRKPVIAYIAGKTAPPGKKMGHAGALIREGKETAMSKIKALIDAGAYVADSPETLPKLVKKSLCLN
ncbi:MAG: succinate--CoA ligase subunit alpha [Candidatus Bathyarchaeia archaeon]